GGWPTSRVQWTAFMSTTHQQGRASRISTTRLRTLAQWLQIHANVAQLGARGWTRRKRRGRSSSRSSGHRAAGEWASPRRPAERVRPYRQAHDHGTAVRRSAATRRRRGQTAARPFRVPSSPPATPLFGDNLYRIYATHR